MNLLIILLVFMVLYRVQYAGKGNYFDCLSMQNTSTLKAVSSILVVMCHEKDYLKYTLSGVIVVKIAYLCVGMFFFISGYGLMYGLTHKKDYLQNFISNRMTKLLLPYLVANLVYIPYKLGFSLVSGFGEMFDLFGMGYPMVTHAWYVIAIMYFYLVFWAVAKRTKNTNLIWIYIGVFTLLYILLVACVLKYSSWWYTSAVAFPLGILFCTVRPRIDTTLKEHFSKYCFIIAILMCIFDIIIRVVYHYVNISAVYYVQGYYRLIVVIVAILLISHKLQAHNKVLDFYGKISFELYLMHSLMLIVFRNDIYLYIKNDLVYALLVLGSSTVVAYPMHQLDSIILKKLIPDKQHQRAML